MISGTEVKPPPTKPTEKAPAASQIPPPAPVAPVVPVTPPAPVAPVKKSAISKDDLNRRMLNGESIQIVNVLEPDHYNLGFIKGSRKIPLSKLEERMSELDKSKPVVTYCANGDCGASRAAAEKLAAKGFQVSAYEGGIKEWKESGLPIES